MAADNLNLLEFLQVFRRGELLEEGNERLAELLPAIRATGGKGSLTITLPFELNDAGQIECKPKVTVKKPQRNLGTGIFFISDDDGLSQRDPNQGDWIDDLETRRQRG